MRPMKEEPVTPQDRIQPKEPPRKPNLMDMAAERIQALEKEVAELKDSLAYYRKLCAPKTLDELEAANIRSIVQDQEQDIATLTAERDRLKAELAESQAHVQRLMTAMCDRLQQVTDSNAENDRLKAEVELLKGQLEDAAAEAACLREELRGQP